MKTTMKKLLALVLATVMAVSLAACGGGGESKPSADGDKPADKPTPDPVVEETIDTFYVRQAMMDEDVLGIAYLGYCEDGFDGFDEYFDSINLNTDEYEALSFLYDIPDDYYIDTEGNELYCIVPKDEDATVTITEWIIDEYNDWQGEEGDVLYHEKSNGHPVLFKCNVSEIMPDMLITITESDGDVYYFVPYITQMDGTLTNYSDDYVSYYDFTPYMELYPDWSEPWGDDWDDGDDWGDGDDWNDGAVMFDIEYLLGSWCTTVYTEDERYLDASFEFYDDGTMDFCYGISGESYDVYYEGEYYFANDDTLPENTIILDLYLNENHSEYEVADALYTAVNFEFNAYSDVVGMIYENGDLLFGNEYDSYYQLEYSVG